MDNLSEEMAQTFVGSKENDKHEYRTGGGYLRKKDNVFPGKRTHDDLGDQKMAKSCTRIALVPLGIIVVVIIVVGVLNI